MGGSCEGQGSCKCLPQTFYGVQVREGGFEEGSAPVATEGSRSEGSDVSDSGEVMILNHHWSVWCPQ